MQGVPRHSFFHRLQPRFRDRLLRPARESALQFWLRNANLFGKWPIGDSMPETTTQPSAPAKFEKEAATAQLRKSIIISHRTPSIWSSRLTNCEEQFLSRLAGLPFPFASRGRTASCTPSQPTPLLRRRVHDGTFDIVLNRVDEGFMSNWLCDIEVGTNVTFHGPHGLFVMREPKHDAVFIATGTGIAPFRSMVQWLFAYPERNHDRQFWLVFGTRYHHGIYYREEFEQIQREHPNFHYTATLSRCGDDWQVAEAMCRPRARSGSRPREHDCLHLPPSTTWSTQNRKMLMEEMGWERKQIVFERYD